MSAQFDYESRKANLEDAKQKLVAATNKLAIDPGDQAAKSNRDFLAHVMPMLERSVQSHPDHAAHVAEEKQRGMMVDAVLKVRNLDSNVRSTLTAAQAAAEAAGDSALATQLGKLLGGGQ
jgi:hypothetical protein